MAYPMGEDIRNLLKQNGEMTTKEIAAALPQYKEGSIRSWLTRNKKRGMVDMPHHGVWCLPSTSTSTKTRPDEELKQISNELRAADANEKTIDKLLNIYDNLLDNYEGWAADNFKQRIDFEQQLLFIENFKWLTAIGDKLMKRWSLVHVGYDTNTRLAQEDAKAKTEERQKEALKDAPIQDKIMIVGKYDPEAEELLDCIPSSLEQMTDEDKEKMKV